MGNSLLIDVLHNASNVELAALFSPEHAIRGQADAYTDDSINAKTRIPIYSLYGKTRKFTPGMLNNIGILIF